MKLELITNSPRIALNLNGEAELTFTTDKNIIEQLSCLKSPKIELVIKEYREKKTKSQNAYLWKLLTLLAFKLHDTPENVYKMFVRDYGVRDYVLIQDKAVDTMIKKWDTLGIGWFAEILRKGKTDGTTTLILYSGSSIYNREEMNRVLEAVVESCKEYQIPVELDYTTLLNENE